MKDLSRKRKIWLVIMLALTLATLAFIWVNSMLSKTVSAEQSNNAHGVLSKIFDFIFGKGVITPNVLRKLVHVAEFFLLCSEINVIYIIIKRYSYFRITEILSIGLFVAVIDESIQILSKRGPAVVDVLIDFIGVASACLFFAIGVIIYNAVKSKRNKEK